MAAADTDLLRAERDRALAGAAQLASAAERLGAEVERSRAREAALAAKIRDCEDQVLSRVDAADRACSKAPESARRLKY